MSSQSILLFILLGITCQAQNLVPNPSFEEYGTCPHEQGLVSGARYWNSFGNSPDYFHLCSSNFDFSPPGNFLGYQEPFNGSAYVGVFAFSTVDSLYPTNQHEYVGTKLLEPLTIGQRYFVSFYASLADITGAAINKLGVLFSTRDFSVDSFCPPPCTVSLFEEPNFAHVYATEIIQDSINWIEIKGSFIADSMYEYVLLGNFFTTSYLLYDTFSSPNGYFSYYYVDNVYVGLDSTTGINEMPNYQIKIYPNPTIDNLSIEICDFNSAQPPQIVLYDILGNEVSSVLVFSSLEKIDLRSFLPGVYLLKIINQKYVTTTKVIVQNGY